MGSAATELKSALREIETLFGYRNPPNNVLLKSALRGIETISGALGFPKG